MKKLIIYISILFFSFSAFSQEKNLSFGIALGGYRGYDIKLPVYYKINENFIFETGLNFSTNANIHIYSTFIYDGTEVTSFVNKKVERFYVMGIPLAINYKIKNFYWGTSFRFNFIFDETTNFKNSDYFYKTAPENRFGIANKFVVGYQYKINEKYTIFAEINRNTFTTYKYLNRMSFLIGIKI